jgi:hypothetical protein
MITRVVDTTKGSPIGSRGMRAGLASQSAVSWTKGVKG